MKSNSALLALITIMLAGMVGAAGVYTLNTPANGGGALVPSDDNNNDNGTDPVPVPDPVPTPVPDDKNDLLEPTVTANGLLFSGGAGEFNTTLFFLVEGEVVDNLTVYYPVPDSRYMTAFCHPNGTCLSGTNQDVQRDGNVGLHDSSGYSYVSTDSVFSPGEYYLHIIMPGNWTYSFEQTPVDWPDPTPVETHDFVGKGNGVTDYYYLDKGVHIFRVNVTQGANDKFALNLVSRSGDVYSLLMKDRTGSYQGDLCIGMGELVSPHDGEGDWYTYPDNYRLEVTATGTWTIDMWEPSGKGRILPQTFKGSTDAVYSLYLPGNYTNVKFSLSYTGSGFVAVYLWSAFSNAHSAFSTGEGAFLYPAIDGVSQRTIAIGGFIADENFGPWYYPPAGVYYAGILADDANYTLTVELV